MRKDPSEYADYMAIGQRDFLNVGDGVEVQLVALGTTKNPGLPSDRNPDRLSGCLVLHAVTTAQHQSCVHFVSTPYKRTLFRIEKDRFFDFSCFHHAESLAT